jgi:hypothetical protein
MPFSVVSLVGLDMTESAYFWSVSGVVNISFIDCHLVMGDYMHHDKGCISTSNFEAVSFKMLQHVTNTRCFNLSVGRVTQSGHAGLPLPHLIFKITPLFCSYF